MGVPSSAITEVKILNELNIKSQIEQYQQKTFTILQTNDKMNSSNRNFKFVKPKVYPNLKNTVHDSPSYSEMLLKESTESTRVKSQLLTTNVHVNPNFKPQNLTVHINPNIRAKPLIHINPKMMHDIISSSQNLQNNISTTNLSTTKTSIDNNTVQTNIKRSIYVNPTLMKKLSSSEKESVSSKELITKDQSICSRLKLVKNIDNRKIFPKKTNNSSIVLLSHRKLVRVARTTKSTSKTSLISQCRLPKSTENCILIKKKVDTMSQKNTKVKPLINNTLQSTCAKSNLLKLGINKSINKIKVTKYKIDRTILHELNVPKVKRIGLSETKKLLNDTAKLVTIGDIVYKASKNKLVRRNCSLKQKRLINGKSDKLTITDKKRRISKETSNRILETNTSSKTRLTYNISLKSTYKNSISNKVKQRSIRILRNKMHKNNQPCLIFQRFGSCPNHKNGACLKRHDKKQVSLCRKFLQGKCLLDKCPLSHDVGPEKMPTCKYFLYGCCTRDACPYLHVKVSSNTSICIDFLQGYCAKGNKCQRRHEYICPEFNKSGSCSKGESCPYPHKSHSSNLEKSIKYLNKTRDVQKHQATSTIKDNSEILNSESRLRYYEITDGLSEDFEKKKETSTIDSKKQMQINETDKSLIKDGEHMLEVMACHFNNRKKQISIGGYIPIDPFN